LDALQALSSLLIPHKVAQLLQIEGPESAHLGCPWQFAARCFFLDVASFEPENTRSIIDSTALAFQHHAYSHGDCGIDLRLIDLRLPIA
jgi:hypothetical protein